jgi:siroheme synthase
VSTVSDFGRDSELLRTRWQLWATRLLRKADRTVVREAEGSLVALARLQIEVVSLRQQLHAARLDDDDVNAFLDDPLAMFEFKDI